MSASAAASRLTTRGGGARRNSWMKRWLSRPSDFSRRSPARPTPAAPPPSNASTLMRASVAGRSPRPCHLYLGGAGGCHTVGVCESCPAVAAASSPSGFTVQFLFVLVCHMDHK